MTQIIIRGVKKTGGSIYIRRAHDGRWRTMYLGLRFRNVVGHTRLGYLRTNRARADPARLCSCVSKLCLWHFIKDVCVIQKKIIASNKMYVTFKTMFMRFKNMFVTFYKKMFIRYKKCSHSLKNVMYHFKS